MQNHYTIRTGNFQRKAGPAVEDRASISRQNKGIFLDKQNGDSIYCVIARQNKGDHPWNPLTVPKKRPARRSTASARGCPLPTDARSWRAAVPAAELVSARKERANRPKPAGFIIIIAL